MQGSELSDFIESYHTFIKDSFDELWSLVVIDPNESEAYSVIGCLLSRQVTLSIELIGAPTVWTADSAPLFLRSMTDLYITFSWILLDLTDRAKKFILHGLGEEKLVIEHYKAEINDMEETDKDIENLIKYKEAWLNSQKRDFLVEVNLGHWAHLDTRKMAEESDCKSLYKFPFKEFSHSVHNMWPHISRINGKYCENPLHKYHIIPTIHEPIFDIDYAYRACKYVDKTFRCLIKTFLIDYQRDLPLDWWNQYFERLHQDSSSD